MAAKPGKEPDAFLSYTRSDDLYAGGRITMFREHLERTVRAITGRPFLIFQDIDGIGLGEHWPDKLDSMLARTRFFMPMLTPSFFQSQACRHELEQFLAAEGRAGRKDLILPIYCIETELLEDAGLRSQDTLATTIHERQRHDWRPFLFEPFDSRDVRLSLQALARKIMEASRRRATSSTGGRRAQPSIESQHALPPSSEAPSIGQVFRDVDAPWCPEMVVIPPGSFVMGSPENEAGREEAEGPRRRVTVDQAFALGRHPVTVGEFAAFVEETGHDPVGAYVLKDNLWKLDPTVSWRAPGFEQTDRHPVVCVSHEDALTYLAWLSGKTGESYTLPTEALWEYACRAGSATPFFTGRRIDTDQANYDGNLPYGGGKVGIYRERTTKIGSFAANAFGLFDMHGNVWEWCADRWHPNYRGAPADGSGWLAGNSPRRVLRGGSWLNNAELLRSAQRYALLAGRRYDNLGFRCARIL